MGRAILRLWWQLHVTKRLAPSLSDPHAIGIIAFMLYRVWDDLLVALEHIVWATCSLQPSCLGAWVLGVTGTRSS